MTVSYAGVGLGYQTPELCAFIEANISPRDLWLWSMRSFPGARLTGFPFRQPHTPERVKIGTLTWPTGASRFATAHYLVDQTQLDAIRLLVYTGSSYQAAPLILFDGVNAITADLWMLPPRPLQTMTDLPLYLLTLVDDRFFWWFRASALVVTGGTTTWDDLFDQIAMALGVTLDVDTVPAEYLLPGDAFNLTDEPLPLILDAVCASVGLRLVKQLDGTYRAQTAEDSRDVTEIQVALLLAGTPGLDGSAGGAFGIGTSLPLVDDVTVLPASVEVVYPVNDSGVAAGTIAYPVTLASLLLPDFAGITGFAGTKTFHCSAVALGTGTPTNDADLTALAEQIATDFYRWQCGRLDLRLVGYPVWTITGLDDHVEYQHDGDCATRIVRGPWLDHLEDLLVWTGPQPGTGLTLSVGEVDLSPVYTNISTLLFDQADGFTVSQPAAGVARIDFTGGSSFDPATLSFATDRAGSDFTVTYVAPTWIWHLPNADTDPASPPHKRGVIDDIEQQWSGFKWLKNSIAVGTDETQPAIVFTRVKDSPSGGGSPYFGPGSCAVYVDRPGTAPSLYLQAGSVPGGFGGGGNVYLAVLSNEFGFRFGASGGQPNLYIQVGVGNYLVGKTGVIGVGAMATSGLVTGLGNIGPGGNLNPGGGPGGAPLTTRAPNSGGFILGAQRRFTDFPATGTQQEAISQPAGYAFSGYVVEIVEPFKQTLPGSITVDVGTAGSPTAYINGGDLTQARGVAIASTPSVVGSGLSSLTDPTSIKVRVSYVPGTLTAGEFKLHVLYNYVTDVGYAPPGVFGPRIVTDPNPAPGWVDPAPLPQIYGGSRHLLIV